VDGWRYAMVGDADPAALCGQVIRTLGKLEDGLTDDPQALEKAVASVLSEGEEKEITLNSLRASLEAAGLKVVGDIEVTCSDVDAIGKARDALSGLPAALEVKAAFVRLAHVYFGALEVSGQSLGEEPETNGLHSVGLLGKEIRVSKRLSETEFALWRFYPEAGIWTDRDYACIVPPDDVRKAGEEFAAPSQPGG
jgi:hypothetical protein